MEENRKGRGQVDDCEFDTGRRIGEREGELGKRLEGGGKQRKMKRKVQ